jgi:plasmid maintenance system antidote protein VapI
MVSIVFGKCLLSDLLHKRGWNQNMLCERTGLKKSQVSAYVNNKKMMSLKTAILISHVIGCHADELYSYSVKEKK